MIPFIKSFNIHPSSSGGGNNPVVNWTNITWNTSSSLGTITSKQITGITGSIDLNISEETTAPTDIKLYYRVDNSEVTGNITGQPGSPWIQVEGGFTGTTFTVNNNQWVSFACWCNTTTSSADTMFVYNASDSNSLLDTFTIQSV